MAANPRTDRGSRTPGGWQMKANLVNKFVIRHRTVLTLGLVLAMAACSGANVEHTYPEKQSENSYSQGPKPRDSVFGPDGLSLFGKNKTADPGSTGIGVNSYLWRASLDAISFMPLASADPFGGVIITDWYAPPETPNERFKLNI